MTTSFRIFPALLALLLLAGSAVADEPSTICPAPTDDCMNESNHRECQDLVDSGCENVLFLYSCPLQFACADDFDNEPLDMDNEPDTYEHSSPQTECVIVNNFPEVEPLACAEGLECDCFLIADGLDGGYCEGTCVEPQDDDAVDADDDLAGNDDYEPYSPPDTECIRRAGNFLDVEPIECSEGLECECFMFADGIDGGFCEGICVDPTPEEVIYPDPLVEDWPEPECIEVFGNFPGVEPMACPNGQFCGCFLFADGEEGGYCEGTCV